MSYATYVINYAGCEIGAVFAFHSCIIMEYRKESIMRWKLDINKKYPSLKVMIQAPMMTEDITKLTTFIDQLSHSISVKKKAKQVEIDILSIIYIETVERKTFLYTEKEMYELDRALYDVEESLRKFHFIRINRQTLVNPRCIKSVKALLNSRFELLMTSEEKLIVTRHYRKDFKALFNKGGIYDA